MRICGIEGCNGKVQARGLCNSHYQRWYRGEDIPTFEFNSHGNKQEEILVTEPDQLTLGWIIGLFEGEAYFGLDKGTQVVVIGMIDEDVIRKLKSIIESILSLSKPIHLIVTNWRKDEQPMFTIRLYGAKARAIMRLIVTRMGNRRRAIIWQSLNGYKPKNKINIDGFISKCA